MDESGLPARVSRHPPNVAESTSCAELALLPCSSARAGRRSSVACKGCFAAMNLDSCMPALGRQRQFDISTCERSTGLLCQLSRHPLTSRKRQFHSLVVRPAFMLIEAKQPNYVYTHIASLACQRGLVGQRPVNGASGVKLV